MGEVASWHAELPAAGWLPPGTPPPTVNVEAGSVIWPDVPLENGFAPMTQRLMDAGWLSPDDAAKLHARIGLAELGKKAQLRVDQDYLAAGWLPPDEAAKLRCDLATLRDSRILSVVFGHHKGAPRPFALRRTVDETGVSGTGIVATGAEFDDGVVVLRWRSEWPTSVVFHDRGMAAVEAVHGHGGKTEIVWLSEELPTLADMEERAESAERKLAAQQPVIDAARAWVQAHARGGKARHLGCEDEIALIAAVDALDADAPEEGTQP